MLREALERIGGFEAFAKPGQTVLIRPDQSVPRLAEEGSTTDPLLVGALIRLAREAGAAKVQVAASSSGFLDSLECMQITGIAAVAIREGAEVIDLGSDRVPNREVDLPEARFLHRVRLPVPLLEAEVIIAAPKARTDYLDAISGSAEFCAGSLNQIWRALQSSEGDILERFADIMTVVRPDLWITDALICGEGDGPHASLPRWCGCLLASADPVAIDILTASLMGRDPSKLRFAAAAEERGLGNKAPIVILGTPLERVAFQAWPSHEGFEYLPVNVLIGKGVSRSGSIGHVKSALETLVRRGLLQQALHTAGTPTIMIGDVDDPEFERHVKEGPYIVFDDAAQPKYRNDPRTFFVPGHPVLSTAMRELMRILQIGEGRQRLHGSKSRNAAGAAASAVLATLAVGTALWMRGSAKRD
ncbi:MAG: DUF362 domain-containing protein [Bryobacteraceae bacterium]